jgi:hypothetical protein
METTTQKKRKKLNLKPLDTVFSQYIRLRDSDNEGYCTCCSSGKRVFWKDCDAGHFVSRKHLATRYHEKNVHAQSRSDNRFNEGNSAGYAIFLMSKYGPDILEFLEARSKQTVKWTQFEINNMTENYKLKVKQLLNEKGLQL